MSQQSTSGGVPPSVSTPAQAAPSQATPPPRSAATISKAVAVAVTNEEIADRISGEALQKLPSTMYVNIFCYLKLDIKCNL